MLHVICPRNAIVDGTLKTSLSPQHWKLFQKSLALIGTDAVSFMTLYENMSLFSGHISTQLNILFLEDKCSPGRAKQL